MISDFSTDKGGVGDVKTWEAAVPGEGERHFGFEPMRGSGTKGGGSGSESRHL